LVISDFEPISSWACFINGIKAISLSHQSALYTENVPRPQHINLIGQFIIKQYAKGSLNYGFHFKKYNKSVFTPIIRSDIRLLKIVEKNYYTVYLPSYSDKWIINILSKIKNIKWKVFSKNAISYYQKKNVYISPINNKKFEKSLANCKGVLCGAGFETPSEAIYLNKKLMVIPMKHQYEQYFNAAALKELGVPVIKSLKLKHLKKIQNWVATEYKVSLDFPNETQQIVDYIIWDFITKQRLALI